ncbi:MAG: hypothetical protein NVSMB17_10650 [Candidatus Dormibacteria bacterium]
MPAGSCEAATVGRAIGLCVGATGQVLKPTWVAGAGVGAACGPEEVHPPSTPTSAIMAPRQKTD